MQDDTYRSFEFLTDDGLRLHGKIYGEATAGRFPIICLPGLSRNSRDFHQVAIRLADDGRRVVAIDYRGRGLSDRDENKANYNIVREAQDVLQMLDALGIEKAAFIGTSRGGLILHVLAALAPQRIAATVLNDVGPVLEADGLRRIRDYLSARPTLSTFSEAASHLAAIHGAEFPALGDADWSDMAHAIYREIDNILAADFDAALVEPLKAMDFDTPLPDMWQQFDLLTAIPLLIIRGENSRLLSQATVAEMQKRHSQAESLTAFGQGHAPLLHLDDVYRGIEGFLSNH